jgi:FkbM family methyltransferase
MLSTKNKILIASSASSLIRAARRLIGTRSDTVEVTRGGIRWQLDLNEGIDFSVFLLGAFERGTVRTYRRLIRRGNVVLDIGANIGAHTLHFARLVGETGRVFAFEPTAFAFSKLSKNLELNPHLCHRVVTEQIMLTDRDDTRPETEIYSSWPLRKTAGLHKEHGGQRKSTVGSRVVTLDSYLDAAGVTKVDFVKIDVDGFEFAVLQGGIRSLKVFKPTILMEMAPYLLIERHHSIRELTELLTSAGFRLHTLNGGRLRMDPAYLSAAVPAGKSLNVLAISEATSFDFSMDQAKGDASRRIEPGARTSER